jgi:Phage tail tube protein, GTA-gp10
MSKEDGTVTLTFGDDEYPFRIAFGQWRELQESVNKPRLEIGEPPAGPMTLLRALGEGNAWPFDVREVIRLGLIGGGMKSDRALVLVKRYVESRPHYESMLTARVVLHCAMFGPPDDPVGKEPTPASEPETPAETNPSGFLNSTASVLQ